MTVNRSTIEESTLPGRQQGLVQLNSCALKLKLSHGCFQASVKMEIWGLHWNCGAADDSGELVKHKSPVLLKKITTKGKSERNPTPPILSWKLSLFHSSPGESEEGGRHPVLRLLCCTTIQRFAQAVKRKGLCLLC